MKVMIIDDEIEMRRAVARQLRDEFEVSIFDGVHEAIEHINECDVILSDFNMDDGDGYDIIEAATPYGIPVVLHTGAHDLVHDRILEKPASKEQLIKAIYSAYNSKRKS